VFVTSVTRTFDVPQYPGHTVTVRKLTRKMRRKAREARQKSSVEKLRDLGGAAFMKELEAMRGAVKAESKVAGKDEIDQLAEDAEKDPLQVYDEDTVLQLGIIGFSPTPIEAPTLDQQIELLQEDAADFIAREIIAYSLGQREDEAAEKNG